MAHIPERLTRALADRYRLDRELGAGGMATVYLAHDLRHDRPVAIKVLHPELSAVIGAERFLAEIKTTAALQHPHILPLFDSGAADGLLFYVMPLVEGETLRARLTLEKQLPVPDAVRFAKEVAGALDYAHRHGVIHRDIKPENILLHDGRALVADFGIALAVQSAGGQRMTQTGLSLGTPQYMSPEQAMGAREITARSDVYALGAVTYEMLTGDPPFTGSSVQAIVARVMSEAPRPIGPQRKSVPESVEAAVLTALEKLPADRFASAAEFGAALSQEEPGRRSLGIRGTPRIASRDRRLARLTWLLAGTTLLASGAFVWLWARGHAPAPPVPVRFTLNFPQVERLSDFAPSPIAISPDGRTVVYVADAGPRQLYVRSLADLAARPLPGTFAASAPFFSPDGRWIGFLNLATRRLFKVPVGGGTVVMLAENILPGGAAWGPGDQIIISSTSNQAGMNLVPASGGTLRPFTKPGHDKADMMHRYPRPLADGTTVLFTSWGGGLASARIGVASLVTGEFTVLDLPGTFPLGVFDGRLLYLRADGTVMAVPFDVKRRRLTGAPLPVLEGIALDGGGAGKIAVSDAGSLVYVRGANQSRLVMVDAHGVSRPLLDEQRVFGHPRFSPDGHRIAFDIIGQSTNIWTYELATKTLTPLTSGGNNDRPEWSPDGQRILFRSDRGKGSSSFWWQPYDGSGAAEPLFETTDGPHEGVLTPDGRTLVYRSAPVSGGMGRRDIYSVSLDGDRKPQPILTSEFDESVPRLSPDGRWLAYTSDESGALEVYVRPFPGPGGRWKVSSDGGTEPIWARSGDRIFFRNGQQLVAATVRVSPGFAPIRREVLFESDFLGDLLHANFDVTPDGKHFLMLELTGDVAQIVVALDWTSTLRGDGPARSVTR